MGGGLMSQRWMYFSALTVCSSSMSMSLGAAWTSPVLASLLSDPNSGVSHKEAAILDALLPAGAVLGSLLGWGVLDSIGRKHACLIGGLLFIASWSILGLHPGGLIFMYIARLIMGLAVGVVNITSGIYIAEIAPGKTRQVLFAVAQVFTNMGLLVEYCLGPFISYQNLVFVSVLHPLFFSICCLFIRETPYYLVSRGEDKKALATLMSLRGRTDVSQELSEIQEMVIRSSKKRPLEELGQAGNRRALALAAGSLLVKQLTGGVALVSYAQPLLAQAGLPSQVGSALLGLAKMATSAFTICLTLYYGIRNLVLCSLAGVSLCLMTLLAYFLLLEKTDVTLDSVFWIPLIALIFFFVFYDFGIGPFPSFIGAELFSPSVLGLGSALALSSGHLGALCTMALITTADLILSLSLFTISTLLSVPLLAGYLVDTKGKSLPQIQTPDPETHI